MGADYLDLAVANTFVRLHFDKFGSLEPKVQAHFQPIELLFLHVVIMSLVKVLGEGEEVPLRLFFSMRKGIPVRAEMPLEF